jgi:hypothetical protein
VFDNPKRTGGGIDQLNGGGEKADVVTGVDAPVDGPLVIPSVTACPNTFI